MSQDYIELFFNAIRARGGWCVNPTPGHFSFAHKKLLMHRWVKSSDGNIEALDQTAILFLTRVPVGKFEMRCQTMILNLYPMTENLKKF